MATIEIVDVTDESRFGLIPPCADPSFDHRSCDYWEDTDGGSKASRPGWLTPSSSKLSPAAGALSANPFAPPPKDDFNPFAPPSKSGSNPFAPAFEAPKANPFAPPGGPADNPFAPNRPARPTLPPDAPRKLQLLGRGLAVFGSYAKALLFDGEPAAYCQFGPLSAYPRALHLRELYPQLPEAPLPAVIACIATTAAARRKGLALRLVEEVCRDLGERGFSAVEAYPECGASADDTPAGNPEFWVRAGFRLAVDDERYPVVRREL